jgi:CBS domain containing-hemolysin-like protein
LLQIFALIGALLLVALNGFFVAAEFGLVKLRGTRVKTLARKHGLSGRILAIVHGRLDAYLSACQLGITLASLGLGWVGEPAFAELLGPLLDLLGVHSERIVHLISLVFAFSLISFLHIVVGELAPKSMAIRQPEKIGLWWRCRSTRSTGRCIRRSGCSTPARTRCCGSRGCRPITAAMRTIQPTS